MTSRIIPQGRQIIPTVRTFLFFLVIGSLVLPFCTSRSIAQSTDEPWAAPLNLSQTGAASAPVLMQGAGGQLQAFWWDRFDGLITAIYDDGAWSSPQAAPIMIPPPATTTAATPPAPQPLGAMPTIVSGGDKSVLAFWQDAAQLLWMSHLAFGETTWSTPKEMAEGVLAWQLAAEPTGRLYLAYLRTAHRASEPAGLYVRRSSHGGESWTSPRPIYTSVYLRLLSADEAYLRVAGSGDSAYVLFDDPRRGQSLLFTSSDGGVTWRGPQPLGDAEQGAVNPQVAALNADEALLLWQARRATTACALYQQLTADGGATWSAPERVLDKLGSCAISLRRDPRGQPLVVASGSGGSLTLAAWQGGRWTEPKTLRASVQDPSTGRVLTLEAAQLAFLDDRHALLALGQDGDVWFVAGQAELLEWIAAPPSPWSTPVALAQNAADAALPAVAVDGDGRVHAMWSTGAALMCAGWDGSRASGPVAIWQPSEGAVAGPSLTVSGDRLHAVWSGGPNGQIYYSQADVRYATRPDGWVEIIRLPMPGLAGASPTIVADLAGGLHVAFAVPVNEGRGIYYVKSKDGGHTWSLPQRVFDGVAAKWLAVDSPTLAVDALGRVHVAWVRAALPGRGLPLAVAYASSADGGETWTDAQPLMEGAYDAPRLVATLTGQMHVLLHEVGSRGGVWQRWSADRGATWTPIAQVPGYRDVTAPVGVAADPNGTLYLAGLGRDDVGEPALLYAIWSGERWEGRETVRLTPGMATAPGVALAVQPVLGRVDVVVRQDAPDAEGVAALAVWHLRREIAAAGAWPTPITTPVPTVTATAAPTPTLTPTPAPTVNPLPPPAGEVLDLGIIKLPFLALYGLGGATALVALILITRPLWARRT